MPLSTHRRGGKHTELCLRKVHFLTLETWPNNLSGSVSHLQNKDLNPSLWHDGREFLRLSEKKMAGELKSQHQL